MSDTTSELRDVQLTFVSAYVRQLDPSATDTAIIRYLAEIETMATALQSLEAPASAHLELFTADWPDGEDA